MSARSRGDHDSKIEVKVLKAYFHELVIATQHSVLEISNKCWAENLITTGTHNEVLYGSTVPQQQATKLMKAVMDSMEHQDTQNSLNLFLKVLDELKTFKNLTRKIRQTIEEEQQRVESSSSTDAPSRPRTVMILAYSGAAIAVLVIAIVVAKYVPSEEQEHQHTTSTSSNSNDVTVTWEAPQPTPTPDSKKDDLMYTPFQSGPEVVDLCLEKLKSPLFDMPDDNNFMRRVAFVMSDFGKNMKSTGGIWQVSLTAFKDTMDTSAHYRLPKKYKKIYNAFGIDWANVNYDELRKPFYSALAARLYLSNVPDYIPAPQQLEEQAKYWKFEYMRGKGDINTFLDKVHKLEHSKG